MSFGKTVPLTKRLIEQYVARYELLRKHGKPKDLPALSEILKADRTEERRPGSSAVISHWWRDTIDRYVRHKTELIIGDATDWDAKSWQWRVPGGAERAPNGFPA